MSERGRGAQQGAALVETVLTMPIVLSLLLGGLMLGYHLYAKMALTYAVGQHARELSRRHDLLAAAECLATSVTGTTLPSVYGLKADNVRAVCMTIPGIQPPLTLVAACYRTAYALPAFRFAGGRGTPRFSGPLADVEQHLYELEQQQREIQRRIARGQYTARDLQALKNIALDAAASDQRARERGLRAMAGAAIEQVWGAGCAGERGYVMTSKAVVRGATSKHP